MLKERTKQEKVFYNTREYDAFTLTGAVSLYNRRPVTLDWIQPTSKFGANIYVRTSTSKSMVRSNATR